MTVRVLFHDVGKSLYFNRLMKDSRFITVQLVTSTKELNCELVDKENTYDVLVTDLLVDSETVLLQGHKAVLTIDGIDYIRSLAERFPTLRIAVLSRYWHIDNVIAAYQAGAHLFARRTGKPDARFLFDLLFVAEGNMVMPAGFDDRSLNRIRCGLDPELKGISQTDQELLFELLRGVPTAEVIESFGWKSPQQLYNRLSKIVAGTGFGSRDELLDHCVSIGLVGVATKMKRF